MDKLEFFRQALNYDPNPCYRKDWVISAFAITRNYKAEYPYAIKKEADGYYGFVDGSWILLSKDVSKPLYSFSEKVTVPNGFIRNIKTPSKVETDYGTLLWNQRVLVYSSDDMIEYVMGPVSIKAVEAKIADAMVSDPADGVFKPGVYYVSNYKKYGRAVSDLAGFVQFAVPASSPKSLRTHPDVYKVRDRLLKENAGRLHDPAVIAGIQDELIKLDREWLKDDRAMGFLIGDKVWHTARKRMFSIHGPEYGFDEGGDAELIVNCLNEGWDLNKFPAMVNSLRAGSYFRGALTALGGEAVKFFMRIFQNTRISEKDCGSKLGVKLHPTSINYKQYINFYQILSNGTPQLITNDNAKDLIGKTIYMRSPGFCKTMNADYCEICMGTVNSANPLSPASSATGVGSIMMYIMMASAHAKALKTAEIDYDNFIT